MIVCQYFSYQICTSDLNELIGLNVKMLLYRIILFTRKNFWFILIPFVYMSEPKIFHIASGKQQMFLIPKHISHYTFALEIYNYSSNF